MCPTGASEVDSRPSQIPEIAVPSSTYFDIDSWPRNRRHSGVILEVILSSFWTCIPENCSLESRSAKNKNWTKSIGFASPNRGWPSWSEINFHQNPLPELNFLVILNCLEIWSILASKMTSKSTLKTCVNWNGKRGCFKEASKIM